jgi:hypothetical protein
VVFLVKLPTILAGPILRRVDTQGVYIWIATSLSLQMGAELFKVNGKGTKNAYDLLSDSSDTKTVRLGKQLYINLIKIMPVNGPFPGSVLLGYNLLFTRGSKTVDLGSFGLLSPDDPNSIVYGDLKYPSFFINSGENSNILYGSCRKLHGKDEDALASGDLKLQETHLHVNDRPHSLFLLGDQIYADDVADPLFPIISSISKKLIGKREKISKLDTRLESEPFCQSIHQIHGRQFIMENFCQFTSNHAHNHLMKLGEFSAMYLLSWGPYLWECLQEHDAFPYFEKELKKEKIYFVFPEEDRFQKQRQKELEQHESRFAEQWEDLRQSICALTKIRRLLANVPTYMIFDDHDITDDWNLSKDWKGNVSSSPLGRHVVANGLAAYWAFQGWGNCPETFDHRFIKTMKRYFKNFTIGSVAYKNWVDCLWSYKSWHFVTPTNPTTLFLDSRTRRTFNSSPKPVKVGSIIEEVSLSPQLISREAWHDMSISLSESGWRSGQPLTIASPAPLYGIGLIDSILHSYVYPLRAVGIPIQQALDYEAWKYNGKGFSEFLKHIFEWKPSTCFILSGDVHYASSVKSTIQSKTGEEANIIQFTSSPMNNMSFSGVWGFFMKSASWFNSLKRKNHSIKRFCDSTYSIVHEDQHTPCPTDFHWKETLNYLSTQNGAIIKTRNNLGLLELTTGSVQNRLLSYKSLEKKETAFESVDFG